MAHGWPTQAAELVEEQRRLAALECQPWAPPEQVAVAGCFLAFARGEQGPGHAGDRGWSAAAVVDAATGRTLGSACVPCVAGAAYEVGLLALREGPALAEAVSRLTVTPDVLIVDGTGRDHPRRAGLAVHLGVMLDLPTIGVTHRPLLAHGAEPGPHRGDWTSLVIDHEAVGAWLRTAPGARPVAVHAAWRTDVDAAVDVVLRTPGLARTPEPLRRARVLARSTRAHAEGRTSQPWRDPI